MLEPAPFHLLIIANRTCPCPGLADDVIARIEGRPGRVHVVAPSLNSRLRHWTSDVDAAIGAARGRLQIAVDLLEAAGLAASGDVGDSDPLVAIADALHTFPAHAVLISTWPEGRSNWLERGLLERARGRFALPIEHAVSRYGLLEEALPAAA
jgi:hypothetical protein